MVPGLPRSVGFGPTASPPFWPRCARYPRSPATNRASPPRRGAPAARRGGAATRPRAPSPASVASTSPRCRSPARPAASATGRRSAARRGSRTGRGGRAATAARRAAAPGAAGRAARSRPRARPRPVHGRSYPQHRSAHARVMKPPVSTTVVVAGRSNRETSTNAVSAPTTIDRGGKYERRSTTVVLERPIAHSPKTSP